MIAKAESEKNNKLFAAWFPEASEKLVKVIQIMWKCTRLVDTQVV